MKRQNKNDAFSDWGFKPFSVGHITTPFPTKYLKKYKSPHRQIKAIVPGRLNCLIKNPVGLIIREPNGEFNYGEISWGVDLLTYAHVSSVRGKSLIISKKTQRPSIVKHFAEITLKTLNYKRGLFIEANNDLPFLHIGSGSSAALATATILAINELLGKPMDNEKIPLFIAQNYGEEIENNPNKLMPVQCTGGTAWMSLGGGLIVIENSRLVDRMAIPDNYIYVIGIPNYPKLDSAKSLEKEAGAVFKSILDASYHMKPLFEKLFLKLKNAIRQRNIAKIGEIIKMIDSNELILAGYERMFPKISKLYFQLRKNIDRYNPLTIFISSAGPGIITICDKSLEEDIMNCYLELDINQVISAKPANNGVKFLK